MEHVRNLMVVRASETLASYIEGPEAYVDGLKKQVKSFSKSDLFYIFSVIMQGSQNLRQFSTKRIPVEMSLLKCCLREPMISVKNAINDIENTAKQDEANATNTSLPQESVSMDAAKQSPQDVINDAENGTENSDVFLDDIWGNFIKRIQVEKISAATFLKDLKPISIQGGSVVIGFPPESAFSVEALSAESNFSLMKKHLSDLLNEDASIEFRIQNKTQQPSNTGAVSARAQQPEIVKKALGIFGGRITKRQT
jgi:hypothetical protein